MRGHLAAAVQLWRWLIWELFEKVHSLWPFHPISVDTEVDENHEVEMEELSSAFRDFRLEDEDDEDSEDVDYRILFQGRDLELETLWRIESARARGSK